MSQFISLCNPNSARWRFISPTILDGFTHFHIENDASGKCIGSGIAGEVHDGTLLGPRACAFNQHDQLFTFVKR